MFHKISSDILLHFCIIPNTKPKNLDLDLFTVQSTLKTPPPPLSHIPNYLIGSAHCKQSVPSKRTGKLSLLLKLN